MTTSELRLASTHAHNATHLRRLRAFVDSDRFARIPPEHQQLILEQLLLMDRLDAVLARRLNLLNIPV